MGDDAFAALVDRLDLETVGVDLYRGHPGPGRGALFGGLVAAQAVVAGGRTVEKIALHSLHAYFLEPGRHDCPLDFTVERVRDGRSFSTRHVVVRQRQRCIFSMTASFTRGESGIEHADPMPAAPTPEDSPEWEEVRARLLGDPNERRPRGALEVRVCDPDSPDPTVRLPARRRSWIRLLGEPPAEPLLRTALLVYITDRTLLRTGARPHGMPWAHTIGASLDHSVWVHRPPRFADWILYACNSPAAHAARSLTIGAIYERDGTRIATVAQEGLLRLSDRKVE
jgi:acyl-CoA thioesterase-2